MAEALKVILERTSVRSFESKQIDDEQLKTVVKAALNAATAMGRQSYHISVVQNRSLLNKISNSVASLLVETEVPSLVERGRDENFDIFHHAPTVVFLSSDGTHYSLADCANSAQNMCLAATALELGSCYIGSFVQAFESKDGDALLKEFNLPKEYAPVFAVALGYPKTKIFDPKKERVEKVTYIR